jgi:hypothetical protein
MKKLTRNILIGLSLLFATGVLAPIFNNSALAADVYNFEESMKVSGSGDQTKQPVFSCDGKAYVGSQGPTNDTDQTKLATGAAPKVGTETVNGVTTDVYAKCQPIVPQVVSIIMYIVGIISVIVLIIAGIMYATSAGDEAKMKKAKGAIIAAIIGLVIALLAWTLVNFVFSAIK